MTKRFMNKEKLVKMAEIWDSCKSYTEVADELDLTVVTVKSWRRKINTKYPNRLGKKSNRQTMDKLIDEVFAT